MDAYYYDAEQDTGELPVLPVFDWGVRKTPFMGCILVTELEAGQFVHYTRTAATTGVFEVVSVTVYPNGGVSVRVKMTDKYGAVFEGGLSYKIGDYAEVVK